MFIRVPFRLCTSSDKAAALRRIEQHLQNRVHREKVVSDQKKQMRCEDKAARTQTLEAEVTAVAASSLTSDVPCDPPMHSGVTEPTDRSAAQPPLPPRYERTPSSKVRKKGAWRDPQSRLGRFPTSTCPLGGVYTSFDMYVRAQYGSQLEPHKFKKNRHIYKIAAAEWQRMDETQRLSWRRSGEAERVSVPDIFLAHDRSAFLVPYARFLKEQFAQRRSEGRDTATKPRGSGKKRSLVDFAKQWKALPQTEKARYRSTDCEKRLVDETFRVYCDLNFIVAEAEVEQQLGDAYFDGTPPSRTEAVRERLHCMYEADKRLDCDEPKTD
eukprot:PhM_4_TR10905/c1_g1_i1/m.96670